MGLPSKKSSLTFANLFFNINLSFALKPTEKCKETFKARPCNFLFHFVCKVAMKDKLKVINIYFYSATAPRNLYSLSVTSF